MSITDFLKSRRLESIGLESVWQIKGDKIVYPLFRWDGSIIPNVQRYRSLKSDSDSRFGWWHPEGVATPRFYWHPNHEQRKAVIEQTKTLYLCSGETDANTLIACGLYNVTAFFGEGNRFKDDELTWFKRLGVQKIVHILDNDLTASTASYEQKRVIASAGIAYEALSPSEKYKDLNEQWVSIAPSTDLSGLLRKSTHHEVTPTRTLGGYDFDRINPLITQALASSWGLGSKKKDRCQCPIHRGDNAMNAQWSERTGVLTCHSQCNSSYNSIQLAEALNINTDEYRKPADKSTTSSTHSKTAPMPTPKLPAVEHEPSWGYVSQSQAAGMHFETMCPTGLPDEIIVNPATVLHQFGGGGLILEPGKVTLLTGMTGMGKTTTVESLFALPLADQGYEVLMMGIEWTAQQYIDRYVVKTLGISFVDLKLHQLWAVENARRQRGLPTTSKGKCLDPGSLSRYIALVNDLVNRKAGRVWYYDELKTQREEDEAELHNLLDVSTLQDVDGEIKGFVIQTIQLIRKLREEGKRVGVVVFDYIQLMTVPDRDAFTAVKKTMTLLKMLAIKLGIHVIVTAQAKKADTEAVQGTNMTTVNEDMTVKHLHSGSAEYVPPHVVNFSISVVPAFVDGKSLNYAMLEVHKNSTGMLGSILVKTNLSRFIVADAIHELDAPTA